MDLKGRIKLAQPLRTPPRPENSKFRSYVFDITQNKMFKKMSAALVLMNCALLYKPWKANEQITQISALVCSLFTFLFLVEAVMKSIALGFVGYWQSRRNRFDLLVTILGLAWIVLNFISIGKKDFVRLIETDRWISHRIALIFCSKNSVIPLDSRSSYFDSSPLLANMYVIDWRSQCSFHSACF
jgi:hypothetical protein